MRASGKKSKDGEGAAQRAAIDNNQPALDFKPVVKLFTPDAQCTWLLTELDPTAASPSASATLGSGNRNLDS
jgi:hypothetical protein